MQERETPRPITSEPAVEAPRPTGPRPFSRLVASPATRRPAIARLLMAAVAGVALLLGLVALSKRTALAVAAWLYSQPDYYQAFRAIELDPPSPPWIKSGRQGLLDQVRAQSGQPEWIPVLSLDLTELERAFKLHSPWVARVERIERAYPNHLRVRLRYREPVGETLWLHRTDLKPIVVDGDGVILPLDDLERSAAGQLIGIVAERPPADPQPGRFWDTIEPQGGLTQPDTKIAAAARLAAFFKDRQTQAATRSPLLSIVQINPGYARGLVAVAADKTEIVWGDPPGSEPPGELSADSKWTLLRHWFETPGQRPVAYPDYLEFSDRRLRRHGDLQVGSARKSK